MMWVLLGSSIAFMLLGVPVALALAGSSLLYIVMTGTAPGFVLVHRTIAGVDSFPLLAVPFFILAGNLINIAGITERIHTSRSRWPGGCAAASARSTSSGR